MKITIKNQLKALSFQFYGTALMLCSLVYFRFDDDACMIFLIFWLVYTIPTIYLHLEYYFINKNEIIEITETDLVITKNTVILKYPIEAIDKVVLFKSRNLDKGKIQFAAMESYYYLKLVTKKGEEIILTRLLHPKTDELIKRLPRLTIIRKRMPFCSIWFNK